MVYRANWDIVNQPHNVANEWHDFLVYSSMNKECKSFFNSFFSIIVQKCQQNFQNLKAGFFFTKGFSGYLIYWTFSYLPFF